MVVSFGALPFFLCLTDFVPSWVFLVFPFLFFFSFFFFSFSYSKHKKPFQRRRLSARVVWRNFRVEDREK